MGISTVTAGRIRKGQLKGHNGEDEVTFMESLPHLALSKVTKDCINKGCLLFIRTKLVFT